MKQTDRAPLRRVDPAGSFTVVLPDVLRQRFERWLRREHLHMFNAPGGDPTAYVVRLPSGGGPYRY